MTEVDDLFVLYFISPLLNPPQLFRSLHLHTRSTPYPSKPKPLRWLFLVQMWRTEANVVQQRQTDKNSLFVHKEFRSGLTPVLMVPTVYLLGYFGPGAGPLKVVSLLVGS